MARRTRQSVETDTRQSVETDILDGMARAIWVHAYMMWATDVEPPPEFPMDASWSGVVPDNKQTRAASLQAAEDLANLVAQENHLGLVQMFAAAGIVAGGDATPADAAYAFGEELALTCIGTREGPALRRFKLPSFEVSLDDDGRSLSWDGGETWHPALEDPSRWVANPARHAQVQSLLFDRERFTERQAERWAQDHGYRYGSLDTTDNYHRLRQHAPDPGHAYRTVDMGHGVRAIVNPGGTTGPEIMIVMRDPQAQTQLIRVLKKLIRNAQFVIADNVGAAIANLECHSFTWVLSDIPLLGKRTGIDLYRYIQEHDPDRVDYFVFVTDDPQASQVHYRVLDRGALTEANVRHTMAGTPKQLLRASPKPAAMTAEQVAAAVREVLPAIGEDPDDQGLARGRFGDKVFIAAIWRALARDPRFRGMSDPGRVPARFKEWLVAANRDRLLSLARADAKGYMNPDELENSEINDAGSTFHFVMSPQSRERQAAPGRTSGAKHLTRPEFVQAVLDTAATIRTQPGPSGMPMGRFGDQKVFVAAIWRALQGDPRIAGMSLDQFKRQLVQAQFERQLNLARADLVGAMDPAEVQRSEIDDRGSTFHFVIDPKGTW